MKTNDPAMAQDKVAWGAVWALAIGVTSLTAAEMLPVSLLSPMATDLAVSEGMAGQAVTTTAVAAFVASLLIPVAVRDLDRRTLLLTLALLQVVSNVVVALAPDLPTLLAGRVLLGLSVGGFWAMSAALAVRLVPEGDVPKALAIIFGGGSIATIAGAPVGSFFSGFMGWRGVFLVSAGFALIALIWQLATVPSLPSRGRIRLATLLQVLKRSQVAVGLLGVMLLWGGHFAFFTYLRPFLETMTGLSVNGVSSVLLAFGVATFFGTSAAGAVIGRNLPLVLVGAPLTMAALAGGLVTLGDHVAPVAILVGLWGFLYGAVPVAWSTWLTRSVPDEAESGGGLLVAAIQIAITAGAAAGGLAFDLGGANGAVGVAGVLLVFAVLPVLAGVKPAPSTPDAEPLSPNP